MSYGHDHIQLAMCGVRILAIIAVVAIVSCAARSWMAFVAGTVGSTLGFVVPEPAIYAQYHSFEGAYLGGLADTANHVLFYGIIGASLACAGAICGQQWWRERPLQYSLRTAFLVLTAAATALGFIVWFL